ncbi:MAG TPA: T9SS type A sorting domain-containing protein [Ignavibacteria bacterium]|nr:T9SS type A sorting domain-containing protein [Ignavibacteria bacterium]
MKKSFSFLISAILILILFYFIQRFYINNIYNKDKSDKLNIIKNTENNESEKTEPGTVPADDWFARQRAFPFDEIPNEEYLKSIEYINNNMEIKQFDNSSGISEWKLAGPKNIEGRVTASAIHPLNPQIVYIGTANGGVWKSTNFCQTWTSVFDGQNTSSIGSIVIDPANPETIYCGTGEANSLRSYYPGTGIYKSVNGGSSWTHTGLDSSYSIGNIAINSSNTQEIFVAASGWTRRKNSERGIYKSSDGGLSWTKKLYLSDSVGAIDVAIDPSNNTKVFAAMWEKQRREDYIKYGGPKSGLYVSANSGDNWTQIGGGFPLNDATLGRISIDISRSNPQIIYALTATANGSTKGLYKSVNGGVNWTNVNSAAAPSSNFAWFNRIVKVHPLLPDVIYCGGIDMNVSTNGGTSFSTFNSFHADQHAVAFAPSNPNYILVGNDGGVDYTTNGNSFIASTTLPITQFYAGEIDFNNPNTILGGAQDNGTVRTFGDTSNWTGIYGGDGFYCLVDYSNSQNVYVSSQNGALGRSTDGGNSFTGASTGLDIQFTNWMTPFVMDKNEPRTLYCGTYKIFKTTNGMQSWTAISPDLANAHIRNLGTITTVDVSKSDPEVIYCGTDDANVWVTTNGGTNWSNINSGLPYRWVTRVAVHPDSANVCYVTLSGYKVDSTGSHIYRTTNFGTNWISIKGNLPDAPINDVVIDPSNTNTLYIATDITVMISTDLGAQWNIISSGIPSNVPCHDLTLHNPTRTLVVWTHGRSAYKITLSPVTNTENNISVISSDYKLYQNYPNPFNPATKINYELRITNYVSIIIYDVLGNEIMSLVDKKQIAGKYEAEFNGSNLSSGVYFYQLKVNGNLIETKRMMLLK